jgi:hypothetical protein
MSKLNQLTHTSILMNNMKGYFHSSKQLNQQQLKSCGYHNKYQIMWKMRIKRSFKGCNVAWVTRKDMIKRIQQKCLSKGSILIHSTLHNFHFFDTCLFPFFFFFLHPHNHEPFLCFFLSFLFLCSMVSRVISFSCFFSYFHPFIKTHFSKFLINFSLYSPQL